MTARSRARWMNLFPISSPDCVFPQLRKIMSIVTAGWRPPVCSPDLLSCSGTAVTSLQSTASSFLHATNLGIPSTASEENVVRTVRCGQQRRGCLWWSRLGGLRVPQPLALPHNSATQTPFICTALINVAPGFRSAQTDRCHYRSRPAGPHSRANNTSNCG